MKIFNKQMSLIGLNTWRINISGVISVITKSKNISGIQMYSAEFNNMVKFNLTDREAESYIENKYKLLSSNLLAIITDPMDE